MTVTAAPLLTAGDRYTLNCTATVEEYLIATPTLTWRLPGNTDDTSIGEQLTVETTSAVMLTFNPLHTSHGGVYECTAAVNISGIDPRTETVNEIIRVQSKLSVYYMWTIHTHR